MSLRTEILSVGSYVPTRKVTNDDLKAYMDTSDEWIRQRTGIEQRYWIEDDSISTSDLALKASEDAIQKAGIKKEDIDFIILGTLSPDVQFPGTSCYLQAKLGLPGVPTLDIRQQCSAFIYGMSIADQFIRSGMYKTILLVGSEVHSKALELSTRGRDVSVLFGDAAGAAILSAKSISDLSTDSHILSTHLHADGKYAGDLRFDLPGTKYPRWVMKELMDEPDAYPQMNGKPVFMHAVKRMPEVLMEGLKENDLSPGDIDLFILHQANLRINDACAKALQVDPDKVFNTIQRFGNTTAATIPLGLAEAEKAGKLKKGMLVASAAFGAGFTWGSAIYRW
ncbi:MAG: 3-oxoacyl-ACP synthase [Bdellovibrionaceae bacterium]|nr:3-oxoacyl-ACP synthase [Pseudobdellovibrionaceae bacterium]|tara:strand:+ start:4156 stop:5169 length:1014 start_codon:yes stop_codon:yes gene_type:complete